MAVLTPAQPLMFRAETYKANRDVLRAGVRDLLQMRSRAPALLEFWRRCVCGTRDENGPFTPDGHWGLAPFRNYASASSRPACMIAANLETGLCFFLPLDTMMASARENQCYTEKR